MSVNKSDVMAYNEARKNKWVSVMLTEEELNYLYRIYDTQEAYAVRTAQKEIHTDEFWWLGRKLLSYIEIVRKM